MHLILSSQKVIKFFFINLTILIGYSKAHLYPTVAINLPTQPVFILIAARRASAGISPSETVFISGENNYCQSLTPHILQVFIVIGLVEASPYKMQHI